MRKRTIISWALGLGLLMLGLYFSMRILSIQQDRQQQQKGRASLPSFTFSNVGGGLFSLDSIPSKQHVYVLFLDPSCDYCTAEVDSILDNLDRFPASFFVFVSSLSHEELKVFYDEYRLKEYANIRLLFVDEKEAEASFGQLPMPTTLVFNKDRLLVKQFFGQVSIRALLTVGAQVDE